MQSHNQTTLGDSPSITNDKAILLLDQTQILSSHNCCACYFCCFPFTVTKLFIDQLDYLQLICRNHLTSRNTMPTLKYIGPKDITKKDASEYGDGKRARSKPESPPSVNVKDGSLAKKDLNSQATVEDDISKRVGRLSIDPLKQTKNIDTTYKNPSIISTKDVTEKENIGEAPFAVLRSPTKSPPAKKHTVQPITVSLSCLSGDPFSNPLALAEIANAALGIASHGYVGHENTKTKKKQIKDPNAPKRPKNCFMFYQADVRSKLKEKFPGVSGS